MVEKNDQFPIICRRPSLLRKWEREDSSIISSYHFVRTISTLRWLPIRIRVWINRAPCADRNPFFCCVQVAVVESPLFLGSSLNAAFQIWGIKYNGNCQFQRSFRFRERNTFYLPVLHAWEICCIHHLKAYPTYFLSQVLYGGLVVQVLNRRIHFQGQKQPLLGRIASWEDVSVYNLKYSC